jgi:uncharacterized protein (UPF0332 family)
MIDREFEKAEQMLTDARTAHEVEISKSSIVSRLYYACFHAAQAALYARGVNPQSHGAVQMLFGRELIDDGEVPGSAGRFLSDMETYRRRVDYGSGGVEHDTDDLIQQTTEFLDIMREITK